MGKGMRIGYGYDVHPLGPGRKLILGASRFPTARAYSAIPIPTSSCMRCAMACSARWERGIWAATIPVPIRSSKASPVLSYWRMSCPN